jgi:hypothetical protein
MPILANSHSIFEKYMDKTEGLDNYYVFINAITSIFIYLIYTYNEKIPKILFYIFSVLILLFWYFIFAINVRIETIIISILWWIMLSFSAGVTANAMLAYL